MVVKYSHDEPVPTRYRAGVTAPVSDPVTPPAGSPVSALVRATVAALVTLALDALLLGLALGGTAPLLRHPQALALLAVWTVSNFTLALRRPVRDQDTVKQSPDARFVMLALFLLPLFAPAVSALGERIGWATAPWDALPPAVAEVLTWTAVAVTATGLWIRITAMSRLGRRFSPQIVVQRTHVLETGGLYARIRHPGYLGSLMAIFGGVLAFQSMLAWPLLALMVLAQSARARREEALLEAHFGDSYRAYRERSGRFLPKLG
jgi:protein-S-isoprenylcysteine O-methyltransferase Ste14